ncbi:hypothetical protein [Streptomyces sp. cg35]|uniref:hypothetical protein n=1 Tax=Streptomyces sp. cg35 TaxID=3421650 RepID=UPI003D181ED0
MGRDAKRAKQARRDKRKRQEETLGSTSVRTLRTPEDIRAAMAKMFPTPKTGDWRPDVLGQEKLSIQPGPGRFPLVNGHELTREMSTELQAERPDQAEHFDYDHLLAFHEEMRPQFEGFSGLFASQDGCAGTQLDHRDGSMSCSRGNDCDGVALPHQGGWKNCDRDDPCAFCDGPPVTWTH